MTGSATGGVEKGQLGHNTARVCKEVGGGEGEQKTGDT